MWVSRVVAQTDVLAFSAPGCVASWELRSRIGSRSPRGLWQHGLSLRRGKDVQGTVHTVKMSVSGLSTRILGVYLDRCIVIHSSRHAHRMEGVVQTPQAAA
ncbi:hypothetical protein PYCCODRAFT_1142015 [Trametes coccinea BRFM310]|uniref:Uncharacterized protein n=1 Tax=Trametes coccinea (strain BRFM310) TaxID=1353009 RepID=A0A1Y2I8G2_TRAC3|nr:hypothetical protein PYCCODRAFT_1265975 [Trametes coccinea BRFM310]OSC97407.1 hypothetical protein PYCCODRAFT_1142015 [Trametes coccinea BRFM310]